MITTKKVRERVFFSERSTLQRKQKPIYMGVSLALIWFDAKPRRKWNGQG